MTQPPMTASDAATALDLACGIIETGDQRLLAADGPADGRPPELSLTEWQTLYAACDRARRILRAPRPASPAPSTAICACGHTKAQHIYEDGACRPGFACARGCEKFTPLVRSPAPVVTEAEIEAAARWLYERDEGNRSRVAADAPVKAWENVGQLWREGWLADARSVLYAALRAAGGEG